MAQEPDIKNDYHLREAEVDAAFRNPDNLVIPVDLEDEMKKSFIDYAMSVISDRALPVSYTHLDVYKRQKNSYWL